MRPNPHRVWAAWHVQAPTRQADSVVFSGIPPSKGGGGLRNPRLGLVEVGRGAGQSRPHAACGAVPAECTLSVNRRCKPGVLCASILPVGGTV